MPRRILVPLAFLLIVVPACAGGGSGGSGAGRIVGTVMAGPQCPVQQAESPCPDRPWQGTVRATATDGTATETAQTDADGSFAIQVPAGTYDVVAVTEGVGPPTAKSERVTIHAGASTQVHLTVDTGIR